MVCMSGGKDSHTLLDLLLDVQGRAPVKFDLLAVNLDQKQPGFPADVLPNYLRERGVPFRIVERDTYSIVKRLVPEGKTYCSVCSRLRRGILYNIAVEEGCTKIALGHHADDFIETLLLNLFFEGSLKAMPARLVSDDGAHVVIRPLVYIGETDCRDYTKSINLPIIGCCCPACGDLSLQRQRVKQLLIDLEREHAGVKHSMLKALANVSLRHLLDTRLHPAVEMIRDSDSRPVMQIRVPS
jgi:tRNA 2-thiocytidine biosynthesis protein TtcA